MKAIKNINSLIGILNGEDAEWQKTIYAETGVLMLINKHGGVLLSNCGYIDLDVDAEYRYLHGKDVTQYTVIKSIQELIKYILEMDSYHNYLIDKSLGQFTKSELFWSVQNQIILADENQRRTDGTVYQDWGLYRISTYNHSIPPFGEKKEEEMIVLDMALVDYDSTEIWIPRGLELELPDALRIVTNEMNLITEDLKDIPQYCVHSEIPVRVPNSFAEMERIIQPEGLFSWLR